MHASNDLRTPVMLDKDVVQTLQSWKATTEPDLNAVLRRILKLDDGKKLVDGAKTSAGEYKTAILAAINMEGGQAKSKKISDRVQKILSDVLKPIDFSGDKFYTTIRTYLNAKSTNSMRSSGLIEYNDQYEKFILTDKGREYLRVAIAAMPTVMAIKHT